MRWRRSIPLSVLALVLAADFPPAFMRAQAPEARSPEAQSSAQATIVQLLHSGRDAMQQSLENHPTPFIERSAYFQLVRVYQKLNRKPELQHAVEQLQRLRSEQVANTNSEQPAPDLLIAPADSAESPKATNQPPSSEPKP